MPPPPDLENLLERARQGEAAAINELFASHRDRLHRMVEVRLDDRLRGRVDASDVIQEAHLDVFSRLAEYFANPSKPFWLWLRLEVGKHLMLVHRQHLGTAMRDVRLETRLEETPPAASSVLLAEKLMANQPSPSQTAARAEECQRIRVAIDSLSEVDREILTLRHYEMLTHRETAELLGITEAAAAKRYVRALDRLQGALASQPANGEES